LFDRVIPSDNRKISRTYMGSAVASHTLGSPTLFRIVSNSKVHQIYIIGVDSDDR
jgi:hypothetical protein